MAKNNGTPDWAKFLDYNQIDSTQRMKFLKEIMSETAQDITQTVARGTAENIAKEIGDTIRDYFRKQREAAEAGDLFRTAIARAEGNVVQAALAKRFGSYSNAVESAVIVGVYRRETTNAVGCERLEHRFVWKADGTENPLVDVFIDIVHDSFELTFTSHVGELKL